MARQCARDKVPGRAGCGFSVIELLAVLLIISLLLALALPAYQSYVVRAKRVQGQASLLRLMQQQERYYSQHNRYLVFSAAAQDSQDGQSAQAQLFQWWSGDGPAATAASSAYEIEAVACPDASIEQCVLLRAMPGTPRVDQHFQDAHCGVLTLRSTGQRGHSGAAGRCWP